MCFSCFLIGTKTLLLLSMVVVLKFCMWILMMMFLNRSHWKSLQTNKNNQWEATIFLLVLCLSNQNRRGHYHFGSSFFVSSFPLKPLISLSHSEPAGGCDAQLPLHNLWSAESRKLASILIGWLCSVGQWAMVVLDRTIWIISDLPSEKRWQKELNSSKFNNMLLL